MPPLENSARRTAILLHRGDVEVGLLAHAAFRTALVHGLDLRPEPDTFGAVLVRVAECRALPAAEGVIGERHRNRDVDADHADIDIRREVARRIAVAREDRDA